MQKSARARAEERFAATQKKGKEALNEKEKARREIAARMAKQKALRLAKEAGHKDADETVETGTVQTGTAEAETVETQIETADSELSPRLPQVHRH